MDAVQRHVQSWVEERSPELAFMVAEQGHSRTRRWHAHGLLKVVGDQPLKFYRQQFWRDWSTRYGRCEFKELVAEGGAPTYCSKYCFKDGIHDLNWWLWRDERQRLARTVRARSLL